MPRRSVLLLVAGLLVAATAGCAQRAPAPGPTLGYNVALHNALPDSIKAAGVIRFAGDAHPPYRVVADDGRTVTGVDVDIQEALGRVLGIRTEITIVSGLPAALSGLLAGKHDAFNGPVKDTAEREKDFDAIVWMITRTAYLLPAKNVGRVATTADLCGKRVAGVSGSVTEQQAAKLGAWCAARSRPTLKFVGLADTKATIEAVDAGTADAAVMTESTAIDTNAKTRNAYFYVAQTAEQGAGVDMLAMLVPKSTGLGPVLLEAFTQLFVNGDYQEIMNAYGLKKVSVPAPEMNTALTT